MPVTRLFLVFICQQVIAANAQTITIISAHTNDPLPFATIQNLRALWAMVGSEKGAFTFTDVNSKSGDTILISFTGYLPIRMVKPEVTTTLKMEPLPEMLQPVEVLPCKGMETGTLRNFKKNKSAPSFASGKDGLTTYAAYLPNNKQIKGIISSIHFSLRTGHVSKIAAEAPFKIRLLSYNEDSQLPGKSLLLKELVVYPKGKEVVVNISDEWIRLPENGIVVVIDFFFSDEKFIYSIKSTHKGSHGKKVVAIDQFYGADIKFILGENLNGKGYNYDYKNNNWHEMIFGFEGKTAPKIQLTLNLCN
jgi:hypothetical protein